MPHRAEVVVHGSGWVAQAAALSLAQLNLNVALTTGAESKLPSSEPTPQARIDHRAMALNAASRALLQSLGAWPEAAACAVSEMRVHDGSALLRFNAREIQAEALNWIVPGAALSQALTQALDQAPRVQRIAPVRLLEACPAALHVICEGAASLLQLCKTQAQSYGQQAIAAVLKLPAAHGGVASQWFEDGEILALLPMVDGKNSRQAALVWSVSEACASALLELDELQFTEELAKAAQLDAPPELLSPRQSWPLVASAADHWLGSQGGQAWVMAGDSAHRVHPLAGLGLNLGLGDVAALSRQLSQRLTGAYWRKLSDPALLRPYVRERQARAAQVFAATDGLFQMQRPRKPSTSGLAAGALATAAGAWPSLRQMGMRLVNANPALKRQLILQAMA